MYSKFHYEKGVKKLGTKILDKMNWNGFAMIEFLWCSKSREFKVIELNPRTWGSIMLSEKCGSQMLENYISLCLKKKIKPVKKLNNNAAIRWFFPYDFLNMITLRYSPFKILNLFDKNHCYIGFTYSSFRRSLYFILYQILYNKKAISKLFKFL